MAAQMQGFGALSVTRRDFADGNQLFTAPCDLDRGRVLFPDLARVLDYWNAKRGNRLMPSRDHLDPAEMVDFLPRIMLAKVEQPLRFRYRLCGTGVCPVHPADQTGLAADELQPPAYGQWIHGQYAEVLRTRSPALHLNVFDTDDRYRSYAHLILPLSHDEVSVDMIMTVDSLAQDKVKMMELLVQLQRNAGIDLGDFYLLSPNRTT